MIRWVRCAQPFGPPSLFRTSSLKPDVMERPVISAGFDRRRAEFVRDFDHLRFGIHDDKRPSLQQKPHDHVVNHPLWPGLGVPVVSWNKHLIPERALHDKTSAIERLRPEIHLSLMHGIHSDHVFQSSHKAPPFSPALRSASITQFKSFFCLYGSAFGRS